MKLARDIGELARGIIFRRSYNELDEVIKRSLELYPKFGGTYLKVKKEWHFRGWGDLQMRFIERDGDAMRYQGHCVEVGTKVRVPGGLRKVEDIVLGEYVETLEGPCRVTSLWPQQEVECVRVGGQVHPVDHCILTDLGWQSYASLLGSGSREIGERFRESSRRFSVSCFVGRIRLEKDFSRLSFFVSRLCRIFYRYRELFAASRAGQRFSRLGWRRLFAKPEVVRPIVGGSGVLCAPPDSREGSGFRYCYLFCFLYGGLLRVLRGIFRCVFPLRVGVAGPSPWHYTKDAPGNIPGCIHLKESYVHPYTGEERKAVPYYVHYSSSKITPIGKRTVCDITVEDANHYITSNGIVNQNSFDWVNFDELGNYPSPFPYNHMLSCLRSAKGVPTRMMATGNPGGPGQAWIKRRWISGKQPDHIYEYKSSVTIEGESKEVVMTRCFIPSKVSDNKYWAEKDPSYISKLALLPKHIRRAFLDGDWDVSVGQAFPDIMDIHKVAPFSVPYDWKRFATMDWGHSKPFSLGLWAFSPVGRLYRIGEYYGCVPGMEDEGLQMDARTAGRKFLNITNALAIDHTYADPACWSRLGHGSTIAQLMESTGLRLLPADRDRLTAKAVFHSMLQARLDDGLPAIQVFNTCTEWWRTVPNLISDRNKIEDVDSKGEDHIYDDTRFAVMSPEVVRGLTGSVRSARLNYIRGDVDYAR